MQMEVAEEIMTPELEIKVLDNGVHIYRLSSWSMDGLEQWESSLLQRFEKHQGKLLSVYDMRGMDTITRDGFDVANRLETNINSDIAYSVAIINNRRVAILVNTLIQMRRSRDRSRIFTDLDEGIAWLLSR